MSELHFFHEIININGGLLANFLRKVEQCIQWPSWWDPDPGLWHEHRSLSPGHVWVVLENSIYVYMRSMGRTCWPSFFKFGTDILFRNILDKFVGQN